MKGYSSITFNLVLLAPKHFEKAYYHCVSRVVNREFVLQEEEKEQFVTFMRMYEQLYGLRVVTYCIMSNHFHILVEVPKRPEADMSEAELVELVRASMGDERAHSLEVEFEECHRLGYTQKAELATAAYQFVIGLHRKGTEKVFKNKITKRYALEAWRRVLYGLPQEEENMERRRQQVTKAREADAMATRVGNKSRSKRKEFTHHATTTTKRISRDKALQVLEEGGKLSEAEYLRCRVRYFCNGAAIGARSFVEEVFQANRKKFGEARKDGARVMRGLGGEKKEQLYNLRNLQKAVFS